MNNKIWLIIGLMLASLNGLFSQTVVEYYKTPKSWNSFIDLYIARSGNDIVIINRGCEGVILSKGYITDEGIKFIDPIDYNAAVNYVKPTVDTFLTVKYKVLAEESLLEYFSEYSKVYDEKLMIGAGLDGLGEGEFKIPRELDSLYLVLELFGYSKRAVTLPTNGQNIYLNYSFSALEYYKEDRIKLELRKNKFFFMGVKEEIKFRRTKRQSLLSLTDREDIPKDLIDIVFRLLTK